MGKPILALAAAALAAIALTACSGSVPPRNTPPEQAISAILIGGRFLLPSGETRDGRTEFNFESGDGSRAEILRIPIRGGQNFLYLVEPGAYRIAPSRSVLGFIEPKMKIVIEGRVYRIPFPPDLLRQEPYRVKPTRVLPMGILEVRVLPALPGRKPEVRVRLDDGIVARRKIVQDSIRDMMDPTQPQEARESAIAWSRALQKALMDILSEEEGRPLYTPAQ